MPAGIDVGLAVAALYAGAIAAVVAFRSLRRLWQSACSRHSPCAPAKPRSRSCPLPCEYPRSPGVLCRDRASHAKIRNLDPWRVPRTLGQQAVEKRAVLLHLGRLALGPDLQGLLRSQARRGQAPQHRRDLPGPPPLQRHLRDAPTQHLLPANNHHPYTRASHTRSLTQNIGTPLTFK